MSAVPSAEIGSVVGGRDLRRDAAENRQRLLDAARDVFARDGLDAGVEDVARAAGVGMGTLYRRFPTKDALIAALVRGLLEDVLVLAHAGLAVPEGRGLERFLYACGAAQSSQSGCLSRLWNDPETVALKEECRRMIGELLRDAQSHGQIREDATPGDIDLVFWSLHGVIAADRLGDRGWRRHLAIMIAGLRPSPRRLTHAALSDQELGAIRASRDRRTT